MKIRRHIFPIAFVILMTILFIVTIFFSGHKHLSDKDMEKYITEFTHSYHNLVLDAVPSSARTQMLLEKKYDYYIIISKQRGAIVQFTENGTGAITVDYSDKRVEEALVNHLGYLVLGNLSQCGGFKLPYRCVQCRTDYNYLGKGCFVVKTDQIYLQGNIMHNGSYVIGDNSSLFAYNTTQMNTSIHFLIMKDANTKQGWSIDNAINDSHFVFFATFPSYLVNTQEFREYLAMPEIDAIAKEIVEREATGQYWNDALLSERDMDRLSEKAQELNVSGEFAQRIYEMNKESRIQRDNDANKKLTIKSYYMSILSVFIGVIAIVLTIWLYMRKKKKNRTIF
jgi:hypothetical protein